MDYLVYFDRKSQSSLAPESLQLQFVYEKSLRLYSVKKFHEQNKKELADIKAQIQALKDNC